MKNILIKASGDVTGKKDFLSFVSKQARRNYVVVICGGGTKISVALKKAGYPVQFNERGCRIMKSREERVIMRSVLEEEERCLQDRFVGKGVVVTAPILYAGSVLCPINGDDLVKAYYLGFDEIYVFTKTERAKKKKEIFKDFPKVAIMVF